MATPADVRRIALSLPAVEKAGDRLAFSVRRKGKLKGFVWVWMERVLPKKPRVPNPGVIAVRVPNLARKTLILSADAVKFFTEPHYDGFPAVLVRLDAVSVAELEPLIEEAWRCQASPDLWRRPKRSSDANRRTPARAKTTKRDERVRHREGNALGASVKPRHRTPSRRRTP